MKNTSLWRAKQPGCAPVRTALCRDARRTRIRGVAPAARRRFNRLTKALVKRLWRLVGDERSAQGSPSQRLLLAAVTADGVLLVARWCRCQCPDSMRQFQRLQEPQTLRAQRGWHSKGACHRF